jgi:hypothetical protein
MSGHDHLFLTIESDRSGGGDIAIVATMSDASLTKLVQDVDQELVGVLLRVARKLLRLFPQRVEHVERRMRLRLSLRWHTPIICLLLSFTSWCKLQQHHSPG